jgi:hypothetical protein
VRARAALVERAAARSGAEAGRGASGAAPRHARPCGWRVGGARTERRTAWIGPRGSEQQACGGAGLARLFGRRGWRGRREHARGRRGRRAAAQAGEQQAQERLAGMQARVARASGGRAGAVRYGRRCERGCGRRPRPKRQACRW